MESTGPDEGCRTESAGPFLRSRSDHGCRRLCAAESGYAIGTCAPVFSAAVEFGRPPGGCTSPRAVASRGRHVVTATTRVPAGDYRLASADRERPAIVIRGSNITVDFRDVVLRGGPRTRTRIRSRASRCWWTAARTSRSRTCARTATRSACWRARAAKLHITRRRPQLQLEAAALQPRRAREPARLDVVPPERQGRVARRAAPASTSPTRPAPRSITPRSSRGRTG